MSDSSSLSEEEVSPATDSLETLIGLSTETGRNTAVTPSSSEGLAISSDAAVASSDSSRPETPRHAGNNQVQYGEQSGLGAAAPSGGHPPQLVSGRPAAVPQGESAASAGGGTGPEPTNDLLGFLQQMQAQTFRSQQQQQHQFQQQQQRLQQQFLQQQEQFQEQQRQYQQQQEHQQELLTAMMQKLPSGRVEAGPQQGTSGLASLPGPHSTQQGRRPLEPGDSSRPVPRDDRAPRSCGLCENQQVHICLHSAVQSVRSDGSVAGPGLVPHLPPPCPRQPSSVGQWLAASELGRGEAGPPPAAAEGSLPHYAESVASSTASRPGFSNNYKKLKKCIAALRNTEKMGEKTITFKLRELSATAEKVRAKVDGGEDLEAGLAAEVEDALDTADMLAENAVIRLDKISTEEKDTKALISARPKMAFEVFTGDVSQYPTFLANQEQLYEMFYDAAAPDKGASQQLFQLSKILSADLARSVLSYSGAENSAQKAVAWLSLKFDSPQLQIPKVYQQLKDISSAKSVGEVPRTCEKVLRKIEALSALTKDDESALPSDVVQAIFRALYLDRQEQKEVLPYLSRQAIATIKVLRIYVENRFKEYELMSSTLGQTTSHKDQKPPRLTNTDSFFGSAAADEGGADDTGGGRGGTRGGRGGGRGAGRGGGGRVGGGKEGGGDKIPAKCAFCVAKSKPKTDHWVSECPWISVTNKSELIATLPNWCLGCLRFKKNKKHKCPPYMSDGQLVHKPFCTTCKISTKLCKAPSVHAASPIPDTFSGHVSGLPLHEEEGQVALWTQSCVNRGSLGSPSLLTSSLTLINEEDTLTIQALWDPGSESSFFSSDLLPFACHRRDVSFKLETLSASAVKAETVHGLEAAFQVQVPGGECVTLRMLQHSGLEIRAHKLKSKILTCSREFASKYNLEEAEPCAQGQSCLKKPPAKLSLILGQDLHHIAPRLVEQFRDEHGCMSVYACSLSQKLLTAGNRIFPYTEETARSALVDTYGFSGTTDDFPELVGDNLSSLPTTALLHSAIQDNFPTAVRSDVTHPTLQFLEDLTSTPSPSGASRGSSSRTTAETTTASTLAAAGASTPLRPVSDQDVSHDGEAGNCDDDREDFEKLHLEIKKEEIRRLLTSGSVSKNLEARLNIFSAAKVVPEHVWKPSCHQCSKCNLCMETGGQTYVERCQTQGFKAHLWRIPHQDGTYHYEVDYLVDPLAEALPCNYMASYQRHLQLRKSFLGLEVEAQTEFSSRLTKGLKSKYWKILSKEEALHLRNKDGLYLPAGFVLKKSGTTKARLVLDPSGSLNGSLLKAPNLEEKIASVLRRTQAMPILFSADVKEAFFKIKVAAASQNKSLFLMDYEPVEKVLQPKETKYSELVTIQATSLIMGVNQSPAYLSLAFGDLAEDVPDQFLQWSLKYLRYLDDIQSGILAEELRTFQDQINFQDPELNSPCQDSDCCSCEADLSIPQVEMLGAPVPLDEQRYTRHLYRYTQFGKDVFHCLVLRAAVLEAALVKADLPTKDAITSLQQHFQHEFVNAARALYTQVLLKGGSPEFDLLAQFLPLLTCGSGNPTVTGGPGGGTGPGQEENAQKVLRLPHSTCRRRNPF